LDPVYGDTPRVLRHTLHSPSLFSYLVPQNGQYKYLTGEGKASRCRMKSMSEIFRTAPAARG
jgi:hypothetical protein